MKPIHVLILALVAAAAVAIAWFTSSGKIEPPSATGTKFLPTLSDNLDAVNQLDIRDANEKRVTISKQDGVWTVAEKSKFRANTSRVRQLLLNAANSVSMEQKTANPEYYERIGVRDVSDADSAATLVTLFAGQQKYELLLGNASNRFGGSTFVRVRDVAESYLVSPAITAPVDVDDWLDKDVLDIASDDVQSVVIKHQNDQETRISKAAMFDSSFELFGVTEDQTVKDAAVRGLARGLSGLRFEDVRERNTFAVDDYESVKLTYTLFSGVLVDVTLHYQTALDDGDENQDGPQAEALHWLTASARFDEKLAQQFVPQPDAGQSEPDDSVVQASASIELTSADLADRRAIASDITEKHRAWVYNVTSARFDSMNQSTASLVVTAAAPIK